MSHFLYSNQSIVSILLSSLYLFVLGIVSNQLKRFSLFSKIVFGLLFFIGIYLLLLTNGRAGWLGFITGLIFLSKRFFVLPKFTQKGYSLSLFIISFLLVLFVVLKKDSSLGRLLIYKISTNIFQENYLWGIGLGKFQIQYNLYQSAYFSHNNIDGMEALLADNTFYAFNDLWQILIEIGIIRFGIIAAVTIVLLVICRRLYTVSNKFRIIYYAALSALLCIATASLFSYPFHVISIQVIALACVSIIVFSLSPVNATNTLTTSFLSAIRVFSFLAIAIVCFTGYQKFTQIQEADDAFELSRLGFKNKSLAIYDSLSSSSKKDGPVLFSYAQQLYNTNRLQRADSVLREAKKYYTDNEVYKLSASIAYEAGNLKQAEKDYKTALYMVPNRMRSRYELFNFYLNKKDTTKAIQWGQSILNMPVKIPSAITDNLLKQTRNSLQTLQKL